MVKNTYWFLTPNEQIFIYIMVGTGVLHLRQFLKNAIFYLHHKVIFHLRQKISERHSKIIRTELQYRFVSGYAQCYFACVAGNGD